MKPTAVRQKLKALEDIILNKKELHEIIKHVLLYFDTSKYKDSMQGLIEKDINSVLMLIDSESK